jgi:hypothetical protein
LAQFLIVLSGGSRRLTRFSLGNLGLAQLAAQRLDLVGQLICALCGCLSLCLR